MDEEQLKKRRREINKRYRQRHPEQMREYRKKYYREHKAEIRLRRKLTAAGIKLSHGELLALVAV